MGHANKAKKERNPPLFDVAYPKYKVNVVMGESGENFPASKYFP